MTRHDEYGWPRHKAKARQRRRPTPAQSQRSGRQQPLTPYYIEGLARELVESGKASRLVLRGGSTGTRRDTE